MDFYNQYLTSSKINVNAPSHIDNFFLKDFVDEYKKLLQEKERIGPGFLVDAKLFNIFFKKGKAEDTESDFDLVFISYLALLKVDFPNLEIGLFFEEFEETDNYGAQFYQLNQHRQHLIINGRQEFFKLYKGRKEYKSSLIFQSGSYLPPLIISPRSFDYLFKRKNETNNYLVTIDQVIRSAAVLDFNSPEREDIFSNFQKQYIHQKGQPSKWSFQDLSGLYLIRMLFDLYLLRYMINEKKQAGSNYKIGQTIVNGKEDADSADFFRQTIYDTLVGTGVFNMSELETYLLSILVRHNDIFKIPTSRKAMLEKIKPFLSEKEEKKMQVDYRELRRKFIAIFNENLKRVINNSKDLAYGMEELAKNMLEHTSSKHGVITGRVYPFGRINNLKNLERDWSKNFSNNQTFLDLNIIDTGLISIKDSYRTSLESEKKEWLKSIDDKKLKKIVDEGYSEDIKELKRYELENFFNFNSIKLYHQINRVKARLGLLIFSQIILKDKNALVQVSSNSINETRPLGYFLFNDSSGIVERVSKHYLSVGTNYNFILPIEEVFQYKNSQDQPVQTERGASASVFLELHNFKADGSGKYQLMPVQIDENRLPANKFHKLDFLKEQIGPGKEGKIPVINAGGLSGILTNSSDWVRFLANMQFTSEYVKEIIIYNMDPDIYIEVINILKLFDNVGSKNLGFWKHDRFVLFFLPIGHAGDIFHFNSLLSTTRFWQFQKINREFALYHLNLARISEEHDPVESGQVPRLDSLFISSGGKLMNFELIIENSPGLSLFEETTRSLLNIEIAD